MSIPKFYGVIASIIALLYTKSLFCNIVWPGLIVGLTLRKHAYAIIAISLLIEAICFHWFLKNISWCRAFLLASVGNAVSTVVGTFVMVLGSFLWEFPFSILYQFFNLGTFSLPNVIATFIGMCLGSAGIELLAIIKVFRYPAKDVWIPILIGNIVTYALTLVYVVHTFKAEQIAG